MSSILFPEILAGPIVRRVEASCAYIWVATSKNYNITAECYEITTRYEGNEYNSIKLRARTKTVSLGENLYIHLIKVTPSTKFKPNLLIGYNLRFQNKTESFDLDDLGLLNPVNPNSIVYGSLKYPSFFIAEKDSSSSSNFLFGSCRKPHGEGEDTLVFGDQFLEQKCRDVTERPEALFLMGDQIYADDVPDSLFRRINLLGSALMGRSEELSTIEPRLAEEALQSSLYKINGRKAIIQRIAKFTSAKSYNHLIEFGEYAAMYLLAWSPVLWEIGAQLELDEPFDEAVEKGHLIIRSKSENLKRLEMPQLKKRYTEQEKHIEHFKEATYKVRRLLANIPTYMIFDDHDITDDWNITSEWKEQVKASPLGKHIVANGLTAFWAFQGWGNQPSLFKRGFVSVIEKYFHELQNGKSERYYHSWVKLLWEHSPWYFVAPTTPKAIFLDTRTMREYDKQPLSEEQKQLGVDIHPPQLVNGQELLELGDQLQKTRWRKGNPLLIISPTPVIGFELIESIVTKFSIPLKMVGISVETVFDMEAWRYNGKGMTRIFYQLSKWKPGECIILSGDVHYSFSVNSYITFPRGQQLKVKQITSSPIKNMSFHKLSPLVKFTATVNQGLQNEDSIYRYCDKSYLIHNVEKDKYNIPTKEMFWKDELKYEFVDGYSIIETENNLGHLSYSPTKTENNYIKENLN